MTGLETHLVRVLEQTRLAVGALEEHRVLGLLQDVRLSELLETSPDGERLVLAIFVFLAAAEQTSPLCGRRQVLETHRKWSRHSINLVEVKLSVESPKHLSKTNLWTQLVVQQIAFSFRLRVIKRRLDLPRDRRGLLANVSSQRFRCRL
jgi:hypothetical protein